MGGVSVSVDDPHIMMFAFPFLLPLLIPLLLVWLFVAAVRGRGPG